MPTSFLIQNFVLFQVGWLSCVIGGASRDFQLAGVFAVIAIVIIHLLRAGNMKSELMLIVVTLLIGTAWDSALLNAGLYTFSVGVVIDGLVPLWLISMWALFATTLNVSMKWMKGRYLLAAVLGGIGGPLAYYAGFRLGAVEFEHVATSLMAVAIGWSVIMPALMALSERFNGYRATPSTLYEVSSL